MLKVALTSCQTTMITVIQASRRVATLRQVTSVRSKRYFARIAAQEQIDAESENVPVKSIKKLLIANRGEIACRIMRTARKVGVRTVAVYSDADQHSMHVRMADESVHIGAAPPLESYLNFERILRAAHAMNVDAIHPGYGFLSENEKFCRQCTDDGIIFVGPPPTAMRDMGLKDASKRIVSDAGVPVVPGYHGQDQSLDVFKHEADKIGYPLMIKAVRGGGGKGMRIAHTARDFESALESAKTEARKSFGDDQVLLEKYVQRPRHIEVQVFGDQHGNYVYLYERDCSVQRRHQKIIEEAPAPNITHAIRKRIGEAAVQVARAVGYYTASVCDKWSERDEYTHSNAGTVEFIVDTNTDPMKFYFMEMNTRLQVEHPITEMITNTDLVDWQLQVAAGRPLPRKQNEIFLNGHAFECRIYAEDADNGFMPSPGRLTYLNQTRLDSLDNVRVETGVQQGDDISVFYDPMISKLVAWGPDREAALNRMKYVLRRYQVGGVATNVEFLMRLAEHPSFVAGDVHTDFIPQHRAALFPEQQEQKEGKKKSEIQRESLAKASLSALMLTVGSRRGGATESNSAVNLLPQSARFFRSVCPLRETFTFIETPRASAEPQKPATKKDSKAANTQNNLNVHVTGDADGVSPSSFTIKIGETENDDDIHVTHFACRPFPQQSGRVDQPKLNGAEFEARCNNVNWRWSALLDTDGSVQVFSLTGPTTKHVLQTHQVDSGASGALSGGAAADRAVMPGVVEKVLVQEGETVKEGQTIMVMIAMKMEYTIKAPTGGVVKRLLVKTGANVNKGERLFQIE